ncbi:SHOCT domain-containing protein [Halegenticoccus soli]|uniref:SHOCT domain-containing protein n=1 Tax=Halegenticoccus soli TaxID=1985678 RepID=UPI000C6CCF78|nr:SHOCT domain-containing protein [Halegenticoccus soli]
MSTDTRDQQLVTIVLIALGALVILPVFFMGFGAMGFGSMMGGGMWGGMWGDGNTAPTWMLLVGSIAQLLFLTVVVGAGYLIYRAATRSTGDEDRALEELRLAYARGELTDDEYETRRESLRRRD